MLHQSYPCKTIEWKWNTLTNRRRNFFNGMFSHSQKIYYKKRSILCGGDGNMQLGNRQKSKKKRCDSTNPQVGKGDTKEVHKIAWRYSIASKQDLGFPSRVTQTSM